MRNGDLRRVGRGFEQLPAEAGRERPERPFDHENEAESDDKIVHRASGSVIAACGACGAGTLAGRDSRSVAPGIGVGALRLGCGDRRCVAGSGGLAGCRLARRLLDLLTGGVVEILEELRVRAEQQPRIAGLQRVS